MLETYDPHTRFLESRGVRVSGNLPQKEGAQGERRGQRVFSQPAWRGEVGPRLRYRGRHTVGRVSRASPAHPNASWPAPRLNRCAVPIPSPPGLRGKGDTNGSRQTGHGGSTDPPLLPPVPPPAKLPTNALNEQRERSTESK